MIKSGYCIISVYRFGDFITVQKQHHFIAMIYFSIHYLPKYIQFQFILW